MSKNKWYVFLLAKTYYEELLEAGVQIYEYVPGFVHAKTMVSDDRKAVVGTINLDYRSLYLHFEDGVYFYRNQIVDFFICYKNHDPWSDFSFYDGQFGTAHQPWCLVNDHLWQSGIFNR